MPAPIYPPRIKPAYHLRYTWTGWTSAGAFPPLPTGTPWDNLLAYWESDGFRLLEHTLDQNHLSMTFSVRPSVSPECFTTRVKSRLQHASRQTDSPIVFSRKLAFRGIGNNSRETVEGYIRDQLSRSDLADPIYRSNMERHHYHDDACRLKDPVETKRGRYWYNLHLVLVVSGRYRIGS